MKIKDKNIFKKIIEENWDNFKKLNPSYDTDQYNNVIEKMLGCGSELGGYAEYRCTCCGQDCKRVAFSCKSMFCLSCTKVYIDNFTSKVSKMLHPGMRYRHVVLTVPDQLKPIFYKNRNNGELLKELMKISYECLEDAVKCTFKRKLKIGMIVVLQTYGRSGAYNPHLHIIMTNGGFDESKNEWKEFEYLPYQIYRKKWQYHLLSMMERKLKTRNMKNLAHKLYKKYEKGFVASIKNGKRPKVKSGLAKYLAKYISSPPISIQRIVEYTGDKVTYWYNDHVTGERKVETLDVLKFVGRMVQHILPKGFQRVRYYGIQATRTLKTWRDKIKKYVNGLKEKLKDVYEVIDKLNYRERYKKGIGIDPFKCKYCGKEMTLMKIWHPKYGVIYDEFERMKKGVYKKKNLIYVKIIG